MNFVAGCLSRNLSLMRAKTIATTTPAAKPSNNLRPKSVKSEPPASCRSAIGSEPRQKSEKVNMAESFRFAIERSQLQLRHSARHFVPRDNVSVKYTLTGTGPSSIYDLLFTFHFSNKDTTNEFLPRPCDPNYPLTS